MARTFDHRSTAKDAGDRRDPHPLPVHRSYRDLSEEEQAILWNGNKYVKGINAFFQDIETQRHKIQFRVLAARYRGKTNCPTCRGKRLRAEAMYVQVGGKTLPQLAVMPIEKLVVFFQETPLSEHQISVSKRLLLEIKSRLDFMEKWQGC